MGWWLQDLALTSPADYYKPGEGSLLQCVLTPADKWMPESVETIAEATLKQVHDLFPSSRYHHPPPTTGHRLLGADPLPCLLLRGWHRELECTWTNVVKLGQSLYREAPGMDVYRPRQRSPVQNFYLAGSYTYQVPPQQRHIDR